LISRFSPGKPEPFLDEETGMPLPGSLSVKISVTINGVEQGMFIKSKDCKRNPVLLFVHGGPGMPEYWLTEFYPESRRIEDYFTVVWWEQRGAGLSYNHNTCTKDSMTAQQFVSDTLAITNYLRDRFAKDKIYMLAHSWGSYIGIQAAAQEPDLYHAYIGMGQLVHQIESEKLAYAYALEAYQEIGNQKMVRRLQAAPPTTVPLPDSYMALRDEYMHGIGIGTTRKMRSVIRGIFLPSWRFRGGYTFREKVNLWRGKIFSQSTSLWDEMLVTDLTLQIPSLPIPVYFLHGKYDYTCAYPLAKGFFDKIRAPIKGFYTFQHSAHSPIFEESDRMLEILLKNVLTGTIDLAD